MIGRFICIGFILGLLIIASCKNNEQTLEQAHAPIADTKDYPDAVGQLMLTHCAVSGCHDDQSYEAAGRLNLSTWEAMLQGAGSNAAVVPYSPDFSTLLFFTNTYEDLGPQLIPTMPYGRNAFSKADILLLKDWIEEGAPNKQGRIPFEQTPYRCKYYVINTLCDQVAVFDADTRLIMRYITVGNGSDNGSPFHITSSPDGKYWMVLNSSGAWYRFRSETDEAAGELHLKPGIWRRAAFSKDGSKALLVDWQGRTDWTGGRLALVDVEQFRLIRYYEAPTDSFFFPLGIAATDDLSRVWLTAYNSNFLYKLSFDEQMNVLTQDKVTLGGEQQLQYSGFTYKASEVVLTPDGRHYLVLCEKTEEVRVYDSQTDILMHSIPVGALPQQLLISDHHNLALVSCMEDKTSFAKGKGAIWVLDLNTFTVVKKLYSGYQPRGMALDVDQETVLVSNRNADPVGADRPHHYTDCEGNNGYVTAIDLKTLERVPSYKAEVSVDPYDITFVKK